MHNIIAIANITFKEGIRHRVLYGSLVIAFLMLLFSLLTSGLFMREILKVLLDICLSMTSIGGLLVPFFLAIGLLAKDIENRTIYTILAKPISRGTYILGKFLGLAMLTAVIMAVFAITTMISIWLATKLYQPHFFEHLNVAAILLYITSAYLGILVLNSTVLLWCSLTTSSFLATLLTLATYVIGQSVEELVRFIAAKAAGVSISPFVEYMVNATMYIFPNLSAFDLKHQAAYGLSISPKHIFFLILYAVTYITIMLLFAKTAFRARDL
jgi:ABC-type transport system involved in multi-copper enzyme maturation permease subunit